MDPKLSVRDWIVAGVLCVMVATFFVVPDYVQRQVDEAQVNIICTSAEANIDQLEALKDISRRLGLPTSFAVPTLPPECG